ncbi:hypothetical protein MKI84_15950 [Ancylobacter sp. A5.8]|uniref:hypothetical protein n=1 Tax=Ancylobacter gelatini TaxID=2919920 RepID=UPI001F4ED4F5|nr:hypothetical protein [Ancylobacter gelatini]MCJ8144417.1 hypothetical protein [Ancylobacter gelatini]
MSLSDPMTIARPEAGSRQGRFARLNARRLLGLAVVGLLAASTAGCFQPMYAQTVPGTDGGTLAQTFDDIEVVFVQGRVGNEVRNDLIFGLTGGAGNPVGVPYKLVVNVKEATSSSAVVNSVTGLPEVEIVRVDVGWQLFDNANPKVPLTTGNGFGTASLDSGYQRFARARAIRDAQNRSATMAAEMIRGQLASYFLSRAPKS